MNAEKQNKYSSSRTVCLTLNGKSAKVADCRPKAITQAKLIDGIRKSGTTIQRMYDHKGMTFSTNAILGVGGLSTYNLFVDKDKPGPSPDTFFIKIDTVDQEYAQPQDSAPLKKAFDVYQAKNKFNEGGAGPNDCGAYAYALNTGKLEDWDAEKAATGLNTPKADYQPEGLDGADQNPDIATGVGESYLISWHDLISPDPAKANHHAATTVISDGEDHVTSEAHSGKPTLERPEFHMYGIGENSFYEKNKAYFKKGEHEAYMSIVGSQKK